MHNDIKWRQALDTMDLGGFQLHALPPEGQHSH